MKLQYYQVSIITSISENTYVKLKQIFLIRLKERYRNVGLLGGDNISIPVDETACCIRRTIFNPKSEAANIMDTIWVIGLICEQTSEVRMKFHPDRRVPSIMQFLRENVLQGTTIKTDGYPSYPEAVRIMGGCHQVVYHSHGFTNEEGVHTN
ncbi:hypothetical protein DMUE_5355 [Dictyocoela muelleri]|nr:hypothetical protein DMUE_5355 [Dictyocoela muelleri]